MNNATLHIAGPVSRPPSGEFNAHTLLVALRCWWHLVLPIGLVLAGGGATAMYFLSQPQYTATMWLLIRERPLVLVQHTGPDDNHKFVENQIELLRSAPVLEPVVSDPAVATTPELATEVDPVSYLRKKLAVRPLGRSDFFEVAFTSQSPEKAALVVNRVGQEYFDLQGKHESRAISRTIDLLQEQQLARQQSVRQLRTSLQELSKQIYGKDAFATTQEKVQASNPYAELEQRLILAQVDREMLAARIKAERELLVSESFEAPAEEVNILIDQAPQVQELRKGLETTRLKIAEHKQRSVDLQRNVAYHQLQKQLTEEEASLQKYMAEIRGSISAQVERAWRRKREEVIAQLEGQLRALDVSVQVWTERVNDKRGVQKEVAVDSLQYELIRADYERASTLLDAISTRILTMQTEQRAPERVEIFRPAAVPMRPDELMPYRKMCMAGAVAFCLPFVVAVGVELLYRRVSSRQDLEAKSGIPVIGEVTTLPARARSGKGRQRGLRLFEESVDGLRTYLSLGHEMRDAKVWAVTSAISREGKTSVAAQLAISIASATNRPTLLIDGDIRSPDMHRIFDIDHSPGLCEVLRGESTLSDAIDTSFSDILHLLTAGTLYASPHRTLGSGDLVNLINTLRDQYDNIIVDTPPILAACEAVFLASACDAAIVCVRRDFSRMDQVAGAFERLKSAGVKTAGAVLTGVPLHTYAYQYGSYHYQEAVPSPVFASSAKEATEETVTLDG